MSGQKNRGAREDSLWILGSVEPLSKKPALQNQGFKWREHVTMTQMQYLILTLTVYLGIILLIALATIAIQFLLGNSYFSFAILILLNMALFLGAYYSNVTFMNVILHLLNPTSLYITSGAWFMENDITLSFAGNEFWIIGVTGVWMILCVKIARNFKLYDRNVSSIHKNIKKDRCTKNEFH